MTKQTPFTPKSNALHDIMDHNMEYSHPTLKGAFPRTRMRRNRSNPWARSMQQETHLSVSNLIWPVFIREDSIEPTCHKMPDIHRYTTQELLDELDSVVQLGISAIMLFPVVDASKKDEMASEALNEEGLLCQAVREIKATYPDLTLITDVALDPYTSHGQDGLVANGEILNDQTLAVLKDHAIVQAKAGADVIAPSEMMDGPIGVLRDHLDKHGFQDVSLMSYAAKYASTLYGPFRDALESNTCLNGADKKTYQMDPANSDEALREVALDISEGADSVIIKPGVPYLDIVQRVKSTFLIPTIAFHVSAEYAMLKAASESGYIDYEETMMELLLCCRRAGADAIITYCALDAAAILKQQNPSHDVDQGLVQKNSQQQAG